MFRESGVYTEIPLKTKMNTENLNPGQRAIFEVVIKNESPYREAGQTVCNRRSMKLSRAQRIRAITPRRSRLRLKRARGGCGVFCDDDCSP